MKFSKLPFFILAILFAIMPHSAKAQVWTNVPNGLTAPPPANAVPCSDPDPIPTCAIGSCSAGSSSPNYMLRYDYLAWYGVWFGPDQGFVTRWITDPSEVTSSASCIEMWYWPNAVAATPTPVPVSTPTPSDADLGPCKQCEAQVGLPINVTNGNTWITNVDYSVPNGLQIVRTWNSRWHDNASPQGMFGDGWFSNYEEQISIDNNRNIYYFRGDGKVWFFATPDGGFTYSLADPVDEHASLTYDNTNNFWVISFADGTVREFGSVLVSGVWAPNRLLYIIDRNGNSWSFGYDSSHRMTSAYDPSGRNYSLGYNNSSFPNLVTNIADEQRTVATYTYDSNGHLMQVNYPDPTATITYQYDTNSMLTFVFDSADKLMESHTYDSSHRGLTSAKANGTELVTVTYPLTGGPQITDSKGNSTTFAYHQIGNRHFIDSSTPGGCASCGALAAGASYSYDAVGNKTASTDSSGNTTNYTFDGQGNLTGVSTVLNGVTVASSYTYNGFGKVLTATDPLGNVTTDNYDAKGNLLSITEPSPDGVAPQPVTNFKYDSKGNVIEIDDPLGNPTKMKYTAAGLVQSVTDALSHVTTYQYDYWSNLTGIVDPVNGTTHPTTMTYDLMNRLTKVTYPDGSTNSFGYDQRGRRNSVTDGNQHTTTYAYDDADRLTTVTDAQTPTPGVTTYAYDTESDLTDIIDDLGRKTHFDYDVQRRPSDAVFPSLLKETYGYDGVGNLTSRTDRNGKQTTYFYDVLNRLTKKVFADSTEIDYTYDLDNHLTTVNGSAANGTYSFTHDNMGRMTSATTAYSFLPGKSFTTKYGYDVASNVLSMTDPQNAGTTYIYDTLNRLTTLTSPQGAFGFGYDVLNRRTSLSRPNGVGTQYSYNAVSDMLSILHKKGTTTLDGHIYVPDHAGNIGSDTNKLPAGLQTTFGYDPVNQLLSATTKAGTQSYSYDLVGNRLTAPGATFNYNSSNELTSATFDNNGNPLGQTSGGIARTFTWDFNDQLASVQSSTGTTTFLYDPFGRRIRKMSGNTASIYVYDGANVLEQLDATGTVTARYTMAGVDEPLAQLQGNTTTFYEADLLGSITSLSNSSGVVAQSYFYDLFGSPKNTGTIQNPFLFTGREYDKETGFYYYRSRYYDPALGRFLNEDKNKNGVAGSLYAYVENAPTKLVDPFGTSGLARGDLLTDERNDAFNEGFIAALKLLQDPDCKQLYCGEGKKARDINPAQILIDTRYYLEELSAKTGGSTMNINEVMLNINGQFFKSDTTITIPYDNPELSGRRSVTFQSVADARAFVLLHELGHQVGIFEADLFDFINGRHSLRVLEHCFKKKVKYD